MKFSKDFFAEETREGFVVPEMMKRAWAAELEVLNIVSELCCKHGIRYYVTYGTLLGAVRHGGFIPWDDDLDICMLRADYDSFINLAKDELPKGFVLSGIYGDEERLWEANQEPQARVIADEKVFHLPLYMNYFHAYPYLRIGIDIFPFDYYPEDISQQYKLVRLCNDTHFVCANWKLLKEQGILEQRVSQLEKAYGNRKFERSNEALLRRELRLAADKLVTSAGKEGGLKVANVLYCKPADRIEDYAPIKGMEPYWFGEGIRMKFENTEVVVPEQYKKVLEILYGRDYMTPRKFTAGHEYPFYKKQEKAFEKLLKESGIEATVDEFCRNWHKMNGGE